MDALVLPALRSGPALDRGQQALLALLRRLDALGYDFVTVTPDTHRTVYHRDKDRLARSLRDLLGWSLPGRREDLDAEVLDLLEAAGALEERLGLVASRLRVARLDGRLMLHSAWPTREPDAVFLGPDSYRFARFIREAFPAEPPRRIVDIGGGCGAGALTAAALAPDASVEITDVNARALRLAAVNAAHAGSPVTLRLTSGLQGVEPGFDLVLANPPFVKNSSKVYASGGGDHGEQLTLDWAAEALAGLAPGGRLLLYSGSAIQVGGEDPVRAGLYRIAAAAGARLTYEELDPDIFGGMLSSRDYAGVERIAAVGAVLVRGPQGANCG